MNKEIQINLLILHHFLTNLNNRRNNFKFIDSKLKNGTPISEGINLQSIHFELRKSQIIDICNFKEEYDKFKGRGKENIISEICKKLKTPFKTIDWGKFKKIRNTYIAHNLRDNKTDFIFLYKRQSIKLNEEISAVEKILKAGKLINKHFEDQLEIACNKFDLEYYKIDFNDIEDY